MSEEADLAEASQEESLTVGSIGPSTADFLKSVLIVLGANAKNLTSFLFPVVSALT